MNVLWYSNAPWAPTGYGNQTQLAMQALHNAGHKVSILANYGLNGQPLNMGPYLIYPGGKTGYSNAIVEGTCKEADADVLITLYDAWPLNFYKSETWDTPWVAWAPIDHLQVPPPVLEALKHADVPVAYSKHGHITMREAGLDAHYIPHGVDTNTFRPLDIEKSSLGFEDDQFIFGFVGTNTGYPSRKSIPELLLAYSLFREFRPHANTVLYMHTLTSLARNGVNIGQITESLGIKDHVVAADQWNYNKGFPTEYLVKLYNAFDVLMAPSMGEGFGIPIMEAISCGTPVIGTRATAMEELIGDDRGKLVDGQMFWSQQGAWQILPDVVELAVAMDQMFVMGKDAFRGKCREFAVENYDFATVVGPMWVKLLEQKPWVK